MTAINVRPSMVAAVALLISLGFCQNAVRGVTSGATMLVPPPPEYLGMSVDPRIVKRLLGTRLLVADVLWLDAMIKSDIEKEKVSFSEFYRAFKSIVALDPDNLYAYWVGGLYLSVIKDDIKGATAILRDGVQYLESNPDAAKSWPSAWQLPFTLGYNLIFEEQEFEAGAAWIRKASEFPNIPGYVRDLGKRVSTEQGVLEVASRVLTDLYRRVSTPEEKAKIEAKMLAVAVRQEIADLNIKFKKFLFSTEAYALPKKRAFSLFMKTIGHPWKDMRGRPLDIDELGNIRVVDK